MRWSLFYIYLFLFLGNNILKNVTKDIQRIEFIADDVGVDDNVRVIGRKLHEVEDRLRNLRRNCRQELIRDGVNTSTSDEDAIVVIQRVFRGHKVRRIVSALFVDRIVRVWDSEAGRGSNI